MDSHQVEGQRRCACATRRLLPPVRLAAPQAGGQLPGAPSDSRSRPDPVIRTVSRPAESRASRETPSRAIWGSRRCSLAARLVLTALGGSRALHERLSARVRDGGVVDRACDGDVLQHDVVHVVGMDRARHAGRCAGPAAGVPKSQTLIVTPLMAGTAGAGCDPL